MVESSAREAKEEPKPEGVVERRAPSLKATPPLVVKDCGYQMNRDWPTFRFVKTNRYAAARAAAA
jgi:hypothetical protein